MPNPDPKYQEYIAAQINAASVDTETSVQKWRDGQRRCIQMLFEKLDRKLSILDVGSGDGIGLRCLLELGFNNLVGVELNPKKLKLVSDLPLPIFECDMHHMDKLKTNHFDIVYSSHTIEHAFDPSQVLSEIRRVLKKNGRFFLILPYPDTDYSNLTVHTAKQTLGLDQKDDGNSLCSFLTNNGFAIVTKSFDSVREPEIWLELRKEEQI